MNRNLARHKIAIATVDSINADGSYNWEFKWEDAFVQPTAPYISIRVDDVVNSIDREIEILTKSYYPKNRELLNTNNIPVLLSDYIFWNGLWYGAYAEAQWVSMGRSSYNRYKAFYSSGDSIWNEAGVILGNNKLPDVPPAFQTEYQAFLDSVGGVTNMVELLYLPLINKLS